MMQSVFELRYQVYCLERGFLKASDYPEGIEKDDFDSTSDHFCEFDDYDRVAGYARLVRHNSDLLFPFQQHCDTLLDDVTLPPPEYSAEVSRLIIRSDHRRQRTARGALVAMASDEARPACERASRAAASPLTLPKLYRQMVVFSLNKGIKYWYAAMERTLARSLLLMNYPFKQITAQVDYYGPVATYMLDMHELQRRLSNRNPSHLEWLTNAEAEATIGTMPPQISPSITPRQLPFVSGQLPQHAFALHVD